MTDIDRMAAAVIDVLSRERKRAARGIREMDAMGFEIDARTRKAVEAMT